MSALAAGVRGLGAVYRRELMAQFTSPLAYVFLAVFLFAIGVFTWEVGGFFEAARADLTPFFTYQPWLMMVFLPAISMGLWSDEVSRGTQELLLTLPVPIPALVLGKFFAAWTVAALALVLTAPMWWTVNYLGSPDNTAIALSYLMSLLMAGAYLAIGTALSALTGSAVIAFVVGVFVSFLLTAAGLPIVLSGVTELFSAQIADGVAAMSILTHIDAAQKGVLEFRAVFYFASLIGVFLALNALWVSARRTGN